jgi:hypothetical protein
MQSPATNTVATSFLDLSLVHHKDRTPPTGLDQPILVVVGPHKAFMQSGDGWTCKLDGHPASRHLHGDYLWICA